MNRNDCYIAFLTMLTQESNRIAGALNETTPFNEKYTAISSGGRKYGMDDRRLYQWVDVKSTQTNKTVAFITMYYNEITPDSGNFHSQFGRLQFYKGDNGLHTYEGESQGYAATKGILKVDFSNAFDPKISIFDDDYHVSQVVKSFASFSESL